jgi:outer membrane protein
MAVVALLASFLIVSTAQAVQDRIDLKAALQRASENNLEVLAERTLEAQALADTKRVEGEFGPRLEALFGVGPITRATGNVTSSTEDKNVWGRTYIGTLRLTQPIFTWGRKSDYAAAANAGVHVKQLGSKLKTQEIRYQVKEAYWGSLYAQSLYEFIQDGKKDFDKIRAEAEKRKNMPAKDGYKLELFSAEIDSAEAEVKKSYDLALAGLGLRVGMSAPVHPKEDWIESGARELKPLSYYQELAQKNRPEYQQLASGIIAKRALAKAEKKANLPVLAFLANYDWTNTNVRPTQPGPLAYDPYNHSTLAAGIGFKLDLQWGLASAKAAKFAAEAEELEAKQQYARDGIPVEVAKAYGEVEEATKKLDAYTKAYKTGKKWLGGELIAFTAGLGKGDALVEAYGARAETVKKYYEAIYRHHMAWANLSRVVGQEVDPLILD